MTDKKIPYCLLVATTLSSFLTPLLGSSVNVALPIMARELSMNATALGWVASSFILAAAITLVPVGRLADIYGRKKIFLYGAVIFTVASFFCTWSPNQYFLIFVRAVQGVGGAMIFSTATAILISAFSHEERGKILGINIAAVYIGLTVGPFIGGLFTEHLGWRYLFLAAAVLGMVVVFLIASMDQEERPALPGEKFDIAGSFLYAVALFALMYGFSLLPSPGAGVLIGVGIICIMFFIRWQLKKTYPLLDIHLFLNNRVFAFSNLAALINYSATFAVTLLLSLYLQHVKFLTPSQTGIILIIEPAVQALFSPLAGRLSDRFEPRIIASIGMVLTVAGLAPLVFINGNTGINYILSCLVVFGIGFAFFSSPNVNATMSAVEDRFYGVASATISTMRLTGQMFSMGITMLVFAVILGDCPLAQAGQDLLLQSMQVIFLILTVICCAGIFASLARGKVYS